MRYKLPDGCVGVTLGGIALDAAKDQTVEASEAAAADLAPHGIVLADEAEAISRAADERRMLR